MILWRMGQLKLKNTDKMIRRAKANWKGNLTEGTGTLTTQSGVLDTSHYSYKTRFEEGSKGTNPEELLAAAHAGCFTMAVVSIITKKNLTPSLINTEAVVTLEGLAITGIHLSISGSVTGMSEKQFTAATKEAEKNCIISKALSVPITSEAHFIS